MGGGSVESAGADEATESVATSAANKAAEAELAAKEALGTLEKHQVTVARAREQLTQFEAALQQARNAHHAAALRPTLEQGAPCPVCEHVVARLPRKLRAPELDDREHAVEQAKRAESKAARALEDARDMSAGAATQAKERRRVAVERAEKPVVPRRAEVPPVEVRGVGDLPVPGETERLHALRDPCELLDPAATAAQRRQRRTRPDAAAPELGPAEALEEDRPRVVVRERDCDVAATRRGRFLVCQLEPAEDALPALVRIRSHLQRDRHELLAPADVAKVLGVPEPDVMAILESGELASKKIGSSYRVTRAALDKYLQS